MNPQKEAIFTFLNHYLSLGTLIGLIVVIIWTLALIYSSYSKKDFKFFSFIYNNALRLGFLVTFLGTLLSLYYSDYLGVLPCGLCWLQRVALYSQLFLFGFAHTKKDYNIFPYTMLLSVFGGVVALYHSYLQWGYSELIPCPVVASTIDCAKPTFTEFGFVTFPFMSVVLFGALILLSLTVNRFKK